MVDVLFTILMFIVAISVLVAVHEFGHFWVAKKLGVKVLRFSIGFGKPLLLKRAGSDQTEYVIASIPLGGYVKMLDEREGEVAEQDLPRAFNRQPIWKRTAIVAAGPVFNFIFAIIAYWILYITGVSGLKPIIGEVLPNTPAAYAGLKADEEIVSIAGNTTPSWEEVLLNVLPVIVNQSDFTLETQDKSGVISQHTLNLSKVNLNRDLSNPLKTIGLLHKQIAIPPIIGAVEPGKPAAKAGLQKGDKILMLNDAVIHDWRQISEYMQLNRDQPVRITYERNGVVAMVSAENYVAHDNGMAYVRIGMINDAPKDNNYEEKMKSQSVVYTLPILQALSRSIDRTEAMSLLTLKLMWKIVTLEFSFRNVGSVIQIAQAAGQSAKLGYERFIIFLAMISISLGVMNLLPIPVLDGGHLLFYLIEKITGRPVSEAVELFGQKLGMALLFALMALAFYNDIMRMIVPGYNLQ
jgi:regulator of sigma E protease